MSEQDLINQIADLKAELNRLKKNRKYGLVWEHKPEDIVLESNENVPLLKEIKDKKVFLDKSLPYNFIIEGDNYHALAVLNYTHRKRFDVIYIDPPYNTGARDWKYNNNFVDINDEYRHSKWLSLMANRLELAKNLLTDDGVLIIAIDDNEVHHLRVLLEQLMPTYDVTSITVVHNPRGNITNNFARTHEYALFVIPKGASVISRTKRENTAPRKMRRWGHNSTRTARPTMFYPIYLQDGKIVRIGSVPSEDFHPKSKNIKLKTGEIEVWPIDQDGVERRWNFGLDSVNDELGRMIAVENKGEFDIFLTQEDTTTKTVWTETELEAGRHGATLVKSIIGKDFPFPKSIHTVRKCLELVIGNRPNANVLDFFAGSGTTGQAVLELNKADDGNRKFILCTNNENNICEEITYERVKRIIKGYKNGKDEKIEGIPANFTYFRTHLLNIGSISKASDEARIKLTYEAGGVIAVREDTLNEIEKNEWWQLFEGNGKMTAIYFREDKKQLNKLLDKLEGFKKPASLYIFSWGKNEYKGEYSTTAIRVEDIPEPILEVYKELNRQ